MATPIVIWGRLMEMRYSPTPTAGGVLCKGRIGRYLFEVMDCYGSHPCAYIHLPKSYHLDSILDPWWKREASYEDYLACLPPLYDGISLPVHGGLTYDGRSHSKRHGVVLGWDYGHCGDWSGRLEGTYPTAVGTSYKKWTVLEILSEIQDAVQWLEVHRLKRA